MVSYSKIIPKVSRWVERSGGEYAQPSSALAHMPNTMWTKTRSSEQQLVHVEIETFRVKSEKYSAIFASE